MANVNGTRALTDQETLIIDKEYKLLVTKLETQTAEQCAFLRRQISDDPNINGETRNRLVQVVDGGGFKTKMFRITDANVMQKPHVQVTYDIHDELYAYLKRADSLLPRRLVGFLEGGIDVTKSEPIAVDTHPLVGKTKVR